ncbi:MAG TPA: AMP-binding protein [Nannocystaceae bacterium]|nr:AMP-binding protein [Nannocystaceae bacterium]
MSWPPLLPFGRAAPVLVDETGEHGVEEVRARVGAIAAQVGNARAVIVACEGRSDFVHAALAAWGNRAELVLPPNLRPAVVGALAQSTGAVVLHDGQQSLGVDVREIASAHGGAGLHADSIADDRPFTALFTSGSTGEPKRIPKLARQLLGEAKLLVDAFAIVPGLRVLSTVPPHHIYGLLFGVLVPLVAGATIVVDAPLLPEEVAAAVAKHRADVLVAAPVHLRAFAVLERHALHGIARVFCSGGPLARETAVVMREQLGAPVTEVLGASETGGIAWRLHDRDAPPFVPLPGITITCADEGRMLLRSPLLDPQLKQPYATDDRIAEVPGGFTHLGRIDDVVKIAGRRVALGDVEARVRSLPGVDDVVALRVAAHDGRGEAIALVVATRVHRPESIRAGLIAWLDPSTLPRRIACVEALPREPNGKLARSTALALVGEPLPSTDAPTLRLIAKDDASATWAVEIDRELRWFEGHFPGEPLLPGVVQLADIALAGIARTWPELAAPRRFPRVKFLQAIAPGDRLILALRRHKGATVELDLRRGDETCMLGSVVFE